MPDLTHTKKPMVIANHLKNTQIEFASGTYANRRLAEHRLRMCLKLSSMISISFTDAELDDLWFQTVEQL